MVNVTVMGAPPVPQTPIAVGPAPSVPRDAPGITTNVVVTQSLNVGPSVASSGAPSSAPNIPRPATGLRGSVASNPRDAIDVDDVIDVDRPGDGSADAHDVEARDDAANPVAKKRRTTRKLTGWIFVDMHDKTRIGGMAFCKLGCLSKQGSDRLSYSATDTGAVARHMKAKHPDLWKDFEACKNDEDSVNRLTRQVEAQNDKILSTIAKKLALNNTFWANASDGLDTRVRNSLTLLMWAVSNGVSRICLNCPLFDAFLRGIGGQTAPNRHELHNVYLPVLDGLVLTEMERQLRGVDSVSLSADGWKDRKRREFISVTLYWVTEASDRKRWQISLVHADLIHLPGSATGETISELVSSAVESFVPAKCLIAAETTDGAANEQLAASRLVKAGNNLHCCAHLIQLAINDVLDRNPRAIVPEECARHRDVVRKCHDLVLLINGHKALRESFSEAARAKIASSEGGRMYEGLVVDVVTRWDSELALMQRLVYFAAEILDIVGLPANRVNGAVTMDRFEIDLADAMTLVLTPLRIFTKFVQNRDCVTLAHVPRLIDELLSQLSPGSFAQTLSNRTPGVLDMMEVFQRQLVISISSRFQPIFESESLALAACYMLPGPNRMSFRNFNVTEANIAVIRTNILDDVIAVRPPSEGESDDDVLEEDALRDLARAALTLARRLLDRAPADADPLLWWPEHQELSALFPVAKMLLAIPASSAEDERVFSSAGFLLNETRTRLDLDNFRKEQRIRSFLIGGTNTHHQQGREFRQERSNVLLREYQRRAAAENVV